MTIKPIRNDTDHAMALARIEELWNSEPGTPEDDEFDVLSVLISDYENKRWPILPPDPVEAIRFHMEQNDFRQKDLAKVLGSDSRASEILNRQRNLSMENIKAIHQAWRIPLEVLFHVGEKAA